MILFLLNASECSSIILSKSIIPSTSVLSSNYNFFHFYEKNPAGFITWAVQPAPVEASPRLSRACKCVAAVLAYEALPLALALSQGVVAGRLFPQKK